MFKNEFESLKEIISKRCKDTYNFIDSINILNIDKSNIGNYNKYTKGIFLTISTSLLFLVSIIISYYKNKTLSSNEFIILIAIILMLCVSINMYNTLLIKQSESLKDSKNIISNITHEVCEFCINENNIFMEVIKTLNVVENEYINAKYDSDFINKKDLCYIVSREKIDDKELYLSKEGKLVYDLKLANKYSLIDALNICFNNDNLLIKLNKNIKKG